MPLVSQRLISDVPITFTFFSCCVVFRHSYWLLNLIILVTLGVTLEDFGLDFLM